jgi:hypothetical protein
MTTQKIGLKNKKLDPSLQRMAKSEIINESLY